MNICANGHNEICYEGSDCPLCEKVQECSDKESELEDEKNNVSRLEDRVSELEDELKEERNKEK